MIEEIAEDFYRIEVPLPMSELKSINSYVIKGQKRHLIVDTGMNTDLCMKGMQEGLKELDVNLEKADFFITHYHGDHFGLIKRLIRDGSSIYINRTEADAIDKIGSGAILSEIGDYILLSGIPEDETRNMVPPEANRPFRAEGTFPFVFVEDGDRLDAGGYVFMCVTTPGHSKGHTCLYEPNRKIFVAGDHILGDITPGIQARSVDQDPLEEYFHSLDKVYALDIDLVLPGHRNLFRNCRERIRELKVHHKERADEVISILKEGGKNAYEVASRMTWNVDCDSWNVFPMLQKFFATGEAFAHLRYLQAKGIVRGETEDEKIIFSLNS